MQRSPSPISAQTFPVPQQSSPIFHVSPKAMYALIWLPEMHRSPSLISAQTLPVPQQSPSTDAAKPVAHVGTNVFHAAANFARLACVPEGDARTQTAARDTVKPLVQASANVSGAAAVVAYIGACHRRRCTNAPHSPNSRAPQPSYTRTSELEYFEKGCETTVLTQPVAPFPRSPQPSYSRSSELGSLIKLRDDGLPQPKAPGTAAVPPSPTESIVRCLTGPGSRRRVCTLCPGRVRGATCI